MNPSLTGPVTPSMDVRRPLRDSLTKAMLYIRKLPFLALHLACIAVFFVPTSTWAVLLCIGCYYVRMFGITAGYHRYFSHRAYKTSRWFQFVLAWLGCSALQRGPLWWAAHHREHHKHSDTELDPHSPRAHGVWWSHVGWIVSPTEDVVGPEKLKDFWKYPELRWIDHWHWVPGLCLAGLCFWLGSWTGLVWGFLLSTILLYHGTFLVNSVCHIFGTRRFATSDDSRNNFWVALLTLGEGWHNNHHHYQSSVRQGFKWWEIDGSYYILVGLSWFGIVWDLRGVPEKKMIPTAV